MSVSMDLGGCEALMRELLRLPTAVQKRVMRPSVSKALTPINRAAKAGVSVRHGYLKKAIGKKAKNYANAGAVWGAVGVRTGHKVTINGRNYDPNNYAHLVEYGTQFAPAHPFLRPAFDGAQSTAFRILANEVEKGLHREVMK